MVADPFVPTNDLLAALPHPTVLVSAAGRMAHGNSAAWDILGHGIVGRHYITVLRQPMVLDAIENCLRHQQAKTTRYLGRSHAGDAHYDLHVKPVPGSAKSGAVLTFVDVSAAEHTGQMRRDFVANVSHEMRTPLTAITGFIETLQGPARNDPEASARFLSIMKTEADRMNALIRDLLSLSRLEAEQRMRPSDTINLADVLDTVGRRMTPLAQAAGAQIDLPVFDVNLPILGDSEQLVQVFTNLIENAVKYGQQAQNNTVKIRISETAHDAGVRGPAVRVDVTDQGDGIDPIHIPRLTERFYRVDSHRSRQMGGTGLGLAIVKHIVNRHRGRLRIKSELGVGSTFSVILPRHFE